jgi:hypothetical protein
MRIGTDLAFLYWRLLDDSGEWRESEPGTSWYSNAEEANHVYQTLGTDGRSVV